jgi:hypothetical protein
MSKHKHETDTVDKCFCNAIFFLEIPYDYKKLKHIGNVYINKMQKYAGIYLLQNSSVHVSGVHHSHHQECIKL